MPNYRVISTSTSGRTMHDEVHPEPLAAYQQAKKLHRIGLATHVYELASGQWTPAPDLQQAMDMYINTTTEGGLVQVHLCGGACPTAPAS